MEKTGSKVKSALLIVGTTITVYLFFRYALFMFVPFILAYFFTKLLRPIVNWIYDKIKMLRMISTTILLLLFLALFGTALFFLGKKLVEQISSLITNFPTYQQSILQTFQKISGCCDKMFGLDSGEAYAFLTERSNTIISNMQEKMVPAITQQSINLVSITVRILAKVGIIFIAVLMMMKDYDSYKEIYEKSRFYDDIHKVTGKLSETGIAYIKTQAIIMLITATIMTCGLFFMKNNYALLLGVLISFLDAFPAIGCGLVLIPWAIIELFSKNVVHAAILITIYLICELTRQFLEPKLLGDRIGIKPVFTLMAMLVGVELFGILGFLLGPLGLVIILAVVKAYES